jgi:aspartokinase-like uncharacterized kinase
MFDALIKVGGSICHTRAIKAYAARWAELASRYRLLFVAGGGLFADQVRALDQHLGLSDSAAHWMAIAAMEQNGYLLADLMRGIPLISDFGFRISESNPTSDIQLPTSAVLLPYALLRRIDPLPHSWEVTSDSLAAWLAGFSGARRLVLLKDVPGVYEEDPADEAAEERRGALAEIARGDLAGHEVVDPYFVKALPPKIEGWILSGQHPQRLAHLLETGSAEGTKIKPES